MEKINRYSTLNWGISTLGCPECNLAQAVELADSYGIKYFEIRTLNNTVDCQKTLYYPENEPVMRKLMAEKRCQVLDSSFGITANKAGQREALEEIARTADDFNIPYIGIYNACSTMSESIALGATLVDGGYFNNVVCATGSHFSSAERQYRYP